MKINNKLVLAIGVILAAFLLFGCTQTGGSTDNNSTGSTGSTYAPTKEFTMTAKQFEFSPSTITVNKGDKVIIHITSADVEHGFALPDFVVSESVQPGVTKDISFTADKSGTFTFFCNIPCGPGHPDMKGTLIVN